MNDDDGSDAAVLARLRGRPELVGVLYERHAPAVFRYLARRAGPGAAEGDLLRESPASPALRKALYNVAAAIPGVRLVGNLKDAAGRTGVGVERNGETLLIDPATGRLLADLEGQGWSSTYLTQGPASTAPAPTAGG